MKSVMKNTVRTHGNSNRNEPVSQEPKPSPTPSDRYYDELCVLEDHANQSTSFMKLLFNTMELEFHDSSAAIPKQDNGHFLAGVQSLMWQVQGNLEDSCLKLHEYRDKLP